MSDTALYLSLAIVFLGVAIILAYIIRGKRRQKQNKDKYRWSPEQDYDVVLRGETPMTPGFPTLLPREKPKPVKKQKQ